MWFNQYILMVFCCYDLLFQKLLDVIQVTGALFQGYLFNPYAGWWLIWPIQNDAKNCKITETMAYGYSSESTR